MKQDDIDRFVKYNTFSPQSLAQSIVGVQPMTGAMGQIFKMSQQALARVPQSKYKFSRAKWYEAEFKWEDAHNSFVWCTEQFGPMDKRPDAWSRWKTMPGNKIAFRDDKDYNWFVLRWGA